MDEDSPNPDAADDDPMARLHQTSDPRELRALAHPVRIALYEALGIHGSLTATQASKIVGGSPTSVAYHLRTLAKYGYVEEAESGDARERPWRISTVGLDFSADSDVPGSAAAARALGDLMFERWLERRARYWARRSQWPAEMRELSGDSRFLFFGTVEEFRELKRARDQLIMRYYDRIKDPSLRPAGSVGFELNLFIHPIETLPPEEPGDEPRNPDAGKPDAGN